MIDTVSRYRFRLPRARIAELNVTCYADIEIDLKPDFMRSGKPGYERLRTSLSKLGEMDLIATFVDHEGQCLRQPLEAYVLQLKPSHYC